MNYDNRIAMKRKETILVTTIVYILGIWKNLLIFVVKAVIILLDTGYNALYRFTC